MSEDNVTGFEYLQSLNKVCQFMSRDTFGKKASKSELKRWCLNSVLRINGKVIKWDENIPDEIESVTLFSKEKRVTIW